jgi:L-threonylcarbamoyladenylate synthase
MFFQLAEALAALPDLGPRTRGALGRLLPGPVTLLLPNPERRFPLACGPAPERLGLRVPDVPLLAAVSRPVMQSSANPSGGADTRRVGDVDQRIRAEVDLEIDGGELPGTPSTVIDLSRYEETAGYEIVREGALSADAVRVALG